MSLRLSDSAPRRISRILGAWIGAGLLLALVVPGTAWSRPPGDGSARAQLRSPRDEAKVKALYVAGTAALSAKDFAAAYRSFAAAYRMAPSAEFLFHLGTLAVAEKNYTAAEDLLRRYLSDPTLLASPEAIARQEEAERLLAQAAAQASPKGEVSVESSVREGRSAFVLINDRLVGQLPLSQPLLLPVGTSKIKLEQGLTQQEAEITVLAGRTAEMRFNLSTGAVIVTLPPAVLLLSRFVAVPPEAQQRLDQAIAQAARDARLAPLRREAAQGKAQELPECLAQPQCQAELLPFADADYVLVAKTERSGSQSPSSWRFSLSLLDPRVADVAAAEKKECERCTVEQAAATVEEAVEQVLAQGMDRPRGTLEVSSAPPGAELLLGERKLGITPYSHAVFVGSYTLAVRKQGFVPHEETVRIEADETLTREVVLAKASEPPAATPPVAAPPVSAVQRPRTRPAWRLVAGGAGLTAGVLFIGFGARALSIDSQCIDEPMPPKLQCLQRYDTLNVGGGLTGAGVALAVAGGLLLALPGPRPLGGTHAN